MSDITLDDHIFAWFNVRQPDEMQRCLNAYDELNRDRDAGSAGDPQGLHCEAAAARAEGIAQTPGGQIK